MAVSILDEKALTPDSGMLTAALGSAYALWDKLAAHVKASYLSVAENQV